MRPLSDALPLRSTAEWGKYDAVQPIPVVFGRVTLSPIQYSQDRRLWCVSDGVIGGVDAVRIDGAAVQAWQWRTAPDAAGRPVAVLELGQALPEGAVIACDVRGLLDADTGAVIENPADVLLWILRNLAGATMDRAELDGFRVACANAGLLVGGVLQDGGRTIRSQIDELVTSVGGVWSGGMSGWAALYPAPAGASRATFSRSDDEFAATAQHDQIATELTLLFAYDYAVGQYGGSATLEAPEPLARWGRIRREWSAPWLRSARAAAIAGERLLEYLSRPVWQCTFTARASVEVGQWVSLQQRLAPVRGMAFVTGVGVSPSTEDRAITAEIPAGAAPRIELRQIASRFEPVTPEGVVVEYVGGVLTLTVVDLAANPLAGARVTLDGVQTQTSGVTGRVQFRGVSAGAHEVHIEAQGYQPMRYTVTL